MDSIYKHRTRERILMVTDMSHASQATSKGITKYVRELRKQAGILAESAGGLQDFLNDFGGGM